MTAKVWNTAFDLLMINEGGYVNDPKDSGGETKYGISKKAYPYVDIPNLTIEQAKQIYKKDYWDRCKCDYLPDALSVAVFDFAVNSGINRAIKAYAHLTESIYLNCLALWKVRFLLLKNLFSSRLRPF